MREIRVRSASTSRQPEASRPIVSASPSSASALPVATIALLGMQSQRWAAPPTMSRSIIVTSAPSDAATVAAVLPAGPPPMITKRTGTVRRLRARALSGRAHRTDSVQPMPEVRHDALSGRTVLVAPGRAARPHSAPLPPAPAARRADCAFCSGNEHETPPEVARTGAGAPDSPGWRVRAVPNKYPLVGGTVHGAHEVVVLSPRHDADLAVLDAGAASEAMRMLRDRAAFHLDAGRVHAQAFINHG